MNETLKVMESRRSCRRFDPERPVSEEDIRAVCEAGTYAASGMGRQSARIIAVTNKELRGNEQGASRRAEQRECENHGRR